jgi:hypothetical protein
VSGERSSGTFGVIISDETSRRQTGNVYMITNSV